MATIPRSPVTRYQRRALVMLSQLFKTVEVESEWVTFAPGEPQYAPRLDLAVGPFAYGEAQCGATYDELAARHQGFIHQLWQAHQANLKRFHGNKGHSTFEHAIRKNYNARCFLAIEIENKVSRKHLFGGSINAASLGRLGVVVGFTVDKVEALVKLRNYLLFLARVEKNAFDPTNLFILSPEQLVTCIAAS